MYTLLVLTHYSWTLRAAETALKYLVPPVSRHWLKSGSVIEADRGVVGVAHRQPHVPAGAYIQSSVRVAAAWGV